MTTLTEKKYVSDLVKEEPHRQISRKLGTISSAYAAVMPQFTVLGKVTASGKYLPYTPGASNGTEVAAAILLHGPAGATADATSADVPKCVLLRGLAVVSKAFLVWGAAVTTQAHKDAAYAALEAANLMTSEPS